MSHIDPNDFDSIEVFPPLGIARMGNAKEDYYIGPEIPGVLPPPVDGIKDANGDFKRQVKQFGHF